MSFFKTPSPWKTLWLHPGDTIARIVADNPRRGVLALASLAYGLLGLVETAAGVGRFPVSPAALFDWRILAILGFASALSGVLNLYLMGWFVDVAAKALGGGGSPLTTRAAIAWSLAALIPILLLALIALAATSGLGEPSDGTVAAVAFTLIVVAVWSWILMLRMVARVQSFSVWRAFAAVAMGWGGVFLLALAFRAFLFQPFSTASTSMAPTLNEGDWFLVSKYAYGYSRWSTPFGAPFEGRVFAREPRRGDVVVFRAVSKDANYVNRVVGLPGDRIRMIAGRLHINGEAAPRLLAAEASPLRYTETLSDGRSYSVQETDGDKGGLDDTEEFLVPPEHVFVLGDNRDNSVDSRQTIEAGGIGFVAMENLIGRATMIHFSIRGETERDGTIAFERIGKRLD